MGIHKMLSVTGDDRDVFSARLREMKDSFEVPYDLLLSRAEMGEVNTGACRVLILSPKENAKGTGVLYLSAGGFLAPPCLNDYRLALKITEETGCDVILPICPLYPEVQVQDTIEALLGAVKLMAGRYPEGSSAVLAFSSGATLCLYLFLALRQKGFPYKLPSRWILNSPFLRIPPSREESQYMDLLAPYDVTIPKEFLQPDGLMGLLPGDASAETRRPADITGCNLRGMPETDLYVGTKEIALAYVQDFEKNCVNAGIKLQVHEGLGMMHCWGLYGDMKEGRKLQKEYFDIFRQLSRIQ